MTDLLLSVPHQMKDVRRKIGGTGKRDVCEILNPLTHQPEDFALVFIRAYISPVYLEDQTRLGTSKGHGRDIEDWELEETIHPGVCMGTKSVRKSHTKGGKMCGIKAQNQVSFCFVDGYGILPGQEIKSAEEFLDLRYPKYTEFSSGRPKRRHKHSETESVSPDTS